MHPADSLVEDLVALVTGEVLQLQGLLREEGHSQVEVVVPELQRRDTEDTTTELVQNASWRQIHMQSDTFNTELHIAITLHFRQSLHLLRVRHCHLYCWMDHMLKVNGL